MMKVSTKSTYAIRALLHLGNNPGTGPVRLSTIAADQKIPLPFLEQIFSKLKKSGLVQAIRGPQGGYSLSKKPESISLGDIISSLEGPIEPVLCSIPEKRSPNCHDVEGCVSRFVCNELDGELSRILKKNTLATLCGQAAKTRQAHAVIPAKAGIQP